MCVSTMTEYVSVRISELIDWIVHAASAEWKLSTATDTDIVTQLLPHLSRSPSDQDPL